MITAALLCPLFLVVINQKSNSVFIDFYSLRNLGRRVCLVNHESMYFSMSSVLQSRLDVVPGRYPDPPSAPSVTVTHTPLPP